MGQLQLEGAPAKHLVTEERLPAPRSFPILLERFDTVRNTEVLRMEWHETDDLRPFFNSPEKLELYFQESLAAWKRIFSEEAVRTALQAGRQKDSMAYLKRVRHIGLILKSAYRLFDELHTEPMALDDFLHKLGEYNDLIKYHKNQEEAAQLLDEDSLRALSQERFDHMGSSVESYKDEVAILVEKIRTINDQDEITMRKFHKMRRNLRTLMNMLQIPACIMPGQPIHDLFLRHYHLSNVMGDIHDRAVKQTIGGAGSYDELLITTPPDIKADLDRVCSLHLAAL